MVGIKKHPSTNGPPDQQSQNGLAATPATVTEPVDAVNTTTTRVQPRDSATSLQDELLAAASYLQQRISENSAAAATDINASIIKALEADDSHTATTVVMDAFLSALDSPADSDGLSSLEGCMQELLVWMKKRCDMDSQLVDKLCEGLGQGTSMAPLRLRCMALVYNSVSETNYAKRFDMLLATILLAGKLDLVSSIVNTVFPKVEVYMRAWDVSVDQKRKMYKACYEALKKANLSEDAFGYNVKFLTLFNGSTCEELDKIKEETVDVIVQAVMLPKLYRFDALLELDTVTRFEKINEKELNLVYELICIFVRDDLAVFLQFCENHPDLLSKFNIDPEVSVQKMRLLTFASLGIESPDLNYDMIASALQIEEKDVEHWVIRAISSGLVDAKINQLKSSVAIYRSTQRMFTREEWLPLSERINIWKQNIGDLLVALRETRDAAGKVTVEAISV